LSSEQQKLKHSERLHQKETKLENKMKLAKEYHHEHALKNPHKYHKASLFNCGNPDCVMCMNPRKAFGEKSMQERKFEQKEKYDGIPPTGDASST
jgi:hypothetical protein